ncbi:hypothetical protein GDO81_008433 [Engystomops pustulosus]|uniref:Uncharacterized protein n=1 Tax=Engystomops pustulosus TaxID=76066 RepID=A0AAV7CEK1_ENGPU|nr:hypothetical protein GDO81_008433 [Engystomops pustulosus]
MQSGTHNFLGICGSAEVIPLRDAECHAEKIPSVIMYRCLKKMCGLHYASCVPLTSWAPRRTLSAASGVSKSRHLWSMPTILWNGPS